MQQLQNLLQSDGPKAAAETRAYMGVGIKFSQNAVHPWADWQSR